MRSAILIQAISFVIKCVECTRTGIMATLVFTVVEEQTVERGYGQFEGPLLMLGLMLGLQVTMVGHMHTHSL